MVVLADCAASVADTSNIGCCASRMQVHCLTGHDDTVCSILSQGTDPQVRAPSPEMGESVGQLQSRRSCLTVHCEYFLNQRGGSLWQ